MPFTAVESWLLWDGNRGATFHAEFGPEEEAGKLFVALAHMRAVGGQPTAKLVGAAAAQQSNDRLGNAYINMPIRLPEEAEVVEILEFKRSGEFAPIEAYWLSQSRPEGQEHGAEMFQFFSVAANDQGDIKKWTSFVEPDDLLEISELPEQVKWYAGYRFCKHDDIAGAHLVTIFPAGERYLGATGCIGISACENDVVPAAKGLQDGVSAFAVAAGKGRVRNAGFSILAQGQESLGGLYVFHYCRIVDLFLKNGDRINTPKNTFAQAALHIAFKYSMSELEAFGDEEGDPVGAQEIKDVPVEECKFFSELTSKPIRAISLNSNSDDFQEERIFLTDEGNGHYLLDVPHPSLGDIYYFVDLQGGKLQFGSHGEETDAVAFMMGNDGVQEVSAQSVRNLNSVVRGAVRSLRFGIGRTVDPERATHKGPEMDRFLNAHQEGARRPFRPISAIMANTLGADYEAFHEGLSAYVFARSICGTEADTFRSGGSNDLIKAAISQIGLSNSFQSAVRGQSRDLADDLKILEALWSLRDRKEVVNRLRNVTGIAWSAEDDDGLQSAINLVEMAVELGLNEAINHAIELNELRKRVTDTMQSRESMSETERLFNEFLASNGSGTIAPVADLEGDLAALKTALEADGTQLAMNLLNFVNSGQPTQTQALLAYVRLRIPGIELRGKASDIAKSIIDETDEKVLWEKVESFSTLASENDELLTSSAMQAMQSAHLKLTEAAISDGKAKLIPHAAAAVQMQEDYILCKSGSLGPVKTEHSYDGVEARKRERLKRLLLIWPIQADATMLLANELGPQETQPEQTN